MYGLVLEGGGAKGAYQIGAGMALKELDIRIKGVSGTSIGAINGAMIVQGDLKKAYDIWYNISPSKVFDVDEEYLEALKNLELNTENLSYLFNKAKDILNNHGLDTTLMRKILEENIDEVKLRNSKLDFGFVTVSLSDMKPLEINLEDVPKGKVIDFLMASANIPVFRLEKMDGKYYIDGGFYDNLPVRILLKKGYKNFIVVRTHGLGITRKVDEKDINITYIDPLDDLGGILDFSQTSARKNLKLGYYDTLKVFKGLKGREYYIQPKGDEDYFIKLLTGLGEDNILRSGEILGLREMPFRRLLFEGMVPKLSELLNAGKNSSYEDIVILLYEALAKRLKLERFKIYSFEGFIQAIAKRYNPDKKTFRKSIPQFIKQSDYLSLAVREELLDEIITVLLENTMYCQ